MKRKYDLRKVKAKRSYTSEELAEVLRVHIQTIREWRREGLKALEENTTPFLFLGNDVIKFLKLKIDSVKVKLKDDEFYCLGCKKAVHPAFKSMTRRGVTIGSGKESVIFSAKCPLCNRIINRFGSVEASIPVKATPVLPKQEETPKPDKKGTVEKPLQKEEDSFSLF
jgi:DNA-binding XRE family transcriptional regulator